MYIYPSQCLPDPAMRNTQFASHVFCSERDEKIWVRDKREAVIWGDQCACRDNWHPEFERQIRLLESSETLCNTQVQEHQAPIDTIETTLATFFHVTIWNLQTDTRWTQRGPLLASIRTCTSFVDGVPPLSSTWRTIGKAKLEHKGKKLDQNGPMNSKGQITPMRLNDVKWCQMFKVSVLILSVSECVLGNRKAPWCNAARAGWCEGTMHPKTSNNRISTCKNFFM